MITRHSSKLLMILIPISFIALGLLIMQAMTVSLNGGMCNYSSIPIWLIVTESNRQKAYLLPPDHCTNVLTQDTEAIWGRDCNNDPCKYQAWKLGAGHFKVYNDLDSRSGSVLRIKGWGAGSRWHIATTWPRPDLSSVNYLLIR